MLRRCLYSMLLVCLINTLDARGQVSETDYRGWSDLSGKFAVSAKLTSVQDENVVLLASDGSQLTVAIRRLCENDREYLDGWNLLRNSEQEEQEVLRLISDLESDSRGSIERLIELEQDSDGFLAGLVCSGVLATEGGPARLDDARKMLDQVISRLRVVRKHFPDAHSNTITSALNNRAVISLRELATAKATTLFEEAATVHEEMPYVIYHNIKLLSEVTTDSDSVFKSSAGNKRRLERLIPDNPPTLSGIQAPARFLYSSLFDKQHPLPVTQAIPRSVQERMRSLYLWPELTCFFCEGTGFKKCSVCTRGIVAATRREQVGFNPLTKQPIIGNRTYNVECPNCKGKSGFKCPACDGGRLPFGG